MSGHVTPERPPAETTLAKYRWPIALIVVCLVLLAGFVLALREFKHTIVDALNTTGNQTTNVIHAVGQEAANALEKFDQQTITRTFEESLPKLSSDPGGRLELASFTVTESFSESNHLTTAWGELDLGATVTEIKVPATYRYYLRLHDHWKLNVTSNLCIVHAPRIKPTLPPAIDTARMEKKSLEGWGRFNADEQMDALEKNITPTLAGYAGDARHLALVREECRKTVAQFVRDWLLKADQWRDDRFTSIKVIFPDENKTNLLTLPASVEFKDH
jgi:hypothetical protein